MDNLQTGGFFNDKVTKSCLFSTVHDAVLHCQTSGIVDCDEVMGTNSQPQEGVAKHWS